LTKPNTLSDYVIGKIKKWEGVRRAAYKDSVGVWTIGVGHTAAAGPPIPRAGLTLTEAEVDAVLRKDLGAAERAVQSLVRVPLTDNQYGALVSFVFNVGAGAFAKSALLRKLNAGHYDAVPGELMKWVNGGGRRIEGLVNRRSQEAALWGREAFVASSKASPTAQEVPPAPRPKAPDILTVDNAVKVATPLSALLQAFTSGPAQIILAAAFAIGGAYLLYRFVRQRQEAAN